MGASWARAMTRIGWIGLFNGVSSFGSSYIRRASAEVKSSKCVEAGEIHNEVMDSVSCTRQSLSNVILKATDSYAPLQTDRSPVLRKRL